MQWRSERSSGYLNSPRHASRATLAQAPLLSTSCPVPQRALSAFYEYQKLRKVPQRRRAVCVYGCGRFQSIYSASPVGGRFGKKRCNLTKTAAAVANNLSCTTRKRDQTGRGCIFETFNHHQQDGVTCCSESESLRDDKTRAFEAR